MDLALMCISSVSVWLRYNARANSSFDHMLNICLSKVRVNTVLGHSAPPLSVKLVHIIGSGSKDAPIIGQELEFDSENALHILDLPKSVDVGNYIFVFEIVLHDPEHKKIYAVEG